MNYKRQIHQKLDLSGRLKIYILGLVSGIMLTIYYVDVPLAIFINNNISQSTYNIFNKITLLGSFKYIVLMNILLLCFSIFKQYLSKNQNIKDKYKNLTKLLLFAALAQSISAVIIQLLKFLFGRMRPFYYLISNQPLNQFTFFNFQYEYVSFPSGHSAGICAFITCLMIIFKNNKYSKLLVIPGFLISFSRLILNVHYLSDIFVGALLGIVLSRITMEVLNNLITNKRF